MDLSTLQSHSMMQLTGRLSTILQNSAYLTFEDFARAAVKLQGKKK
jgi:hypothetical protein